MDTKKVIADGDIAMKKAVDHTLHEFHTLNVGKAQPSMVENIQVEVYGSLQPLKNVAAIMTPDARSITIQPFDKGTSKDIVKAIQGANIGINRWTKAMSSVALSPTSPRSVASSSPRSPTSTPRKGRSACATSAATSLRPSKRARRTRSSRKTNSSAPKRKSKSGHDRFILDIDKALKGKEGDLQKV